jgi:hypothetical protein
LEGGPGAHQAAGLDIPGGVFMNTTLEPPAMASANDVWTTTRVDGEDRRSVPTWYVHPYGSEISRSFSLSVKRNPVAIELRLPGEVDLNAATELVEALDMAISEGCRH